MQTHEVADFVDEIQRTLTISPSLTSASAPHKLFEAYILMLILQAARNEGANIFYEDVFGNIPSEFAFRGGPSAIYSIARNYTHAIIEFNNKAPLEAHVNIYVAGKSGVFHECDVAVIDRTEGITCRQNRVMPRQTKLLLSAECKYYDGSLGLNLGRSFMGLTRDVRPSYGQVFFVTNSSHNSIQKLLAHHKENWQHEIRPSVNNNITRIRSLFQEVFKNFKQRSKSF